MDRSPVYDVVRPAALLSVLMIVCGCTQMAVIGKVLVGDPTVEGAFSKMTGKDLDDGARVALIVTAPDSITSEYDSVALDVQEELERLMTRRGITMVNSDKIVNVLSLQGGQFDADLIAEQIDADFLLNIDIEYFDHRVPNSADLYHGVAGGNVYGYQIVDNKESTLGRHPIRVFEREFQSEYPGKHPVPADRVPDRVFRNRFIDSLSADLGRMFYDFKTQEAF